MKRKEVVENEGKDIKVLKEEEIEICDLLWLNEEK